MEEIIKKAEILRDDLAFRREYKLCNDKQISYKMDELIRLLKEVHSANKPE
jgi:hypothetical protein